MLTVYSRNDKGFSWEQYLEFTLHTVSSGADLVKHSGKLTKTSPLTEPTAELVKTGAEWALKVLDMHTKAKAARGLQRNFNRLIASSDAVDATLRRGFVSMASSVADLSSTMGEISDGLWAVESTMRRGFAAVNSKLDHISDHLSHISTQVEHISGQIEALRADFNWGMGALYWQMEAQQQQLKSLQDVLREPRKTEATELRQSAIQAYERGLVSGPEWFDDALKDFLASADKNRYDFFVNFYIADIYLYHQQPADLHKARKYFLDASRYAELIKGTAFYYSALALMYAGFVCYLQRDDGAAIEYSGQATKLYPSLIEASYNHAKFAAAAGLAEVAIPSLERALRTERDYAVKVYLDTDFECIEEDVSRLIERLLAEARSEFATRLTRLEQVVVSGRLPKGEEREKLPVLLEDARALARGGTYLAYRDALSRLSEAGQVLERLRLYERDQLLRQAAAEAARLRGEISRYEIGVGLRDSTYAALDALDVSLTTDLRREDALQAMSAAEESRREWEKIVTEGWPRLCFKVDDRSVISTAFATDNKTLFVNAGYGNETCWDLQSGERLKDRPEVRYRPPSEHTSDGRSVVGFYQGSNPEIWLTDVKTGNTVARARWPYKMLRDVALSPDGSTVACAYREGVMLWQVRGWREGHKLLSWSQRQRGASVAFSPDGRFLAAAECDGNLRVWKKVNPLGAGAEEERAEGSDPTTWDAYATLDGPTRVFTFSRDGKTLVAVIASRIVLWDTESRTPRAEINDCVGTVTSIAFSRDGTILAIGTYEGAVYIRDWVWCRKE